MKIGVNAFAWTSSFDASWFHLLPQIREHGLDGFELAVFDPAKVAAAEVRRAYEEHGLECTVCAILPPGLNPISPDAALRKKTLDHLTSCIELTAELGAKTTGGPVFAPVGYLLGRRRIEDEWNRGVECFQRLGEVLDANDVTLGLEPLNRFETFFLTNAAEAKQFCEAVNHPRVGVLIDTFHSNIEEKSIPEAMLLLGPHLKHIHASENNRGVPGAGHVDFAGIIAALHKIDYQGYLMIEGFGYSPADVNGPVNIWRELDATPEQIAFQGAEFFRKLIACGGENSSDSAT
jgi:D-psicose/D-tagatose/L-ribulose 3-epimerase